MIHDAIIIRIIKSEICVINTYKNGTYLKCGLCNKFKRMSYDFKNIGNICNKCYYTEVLILGK